jgi:hypothetical protein
MNDLNRLFIHREHRQEMREIYERFTGDRQPAEAAADHHDVVGVLPRSPGRCAGRPGPRCVVLSAHPVS